jgi:hypothetical protein
VGEINISENTKSIPCIINDFCNFHRVVSFIYYELFFY